MTPLPDIVLKIRAFLLAIILSLSSSCFSQGFDEEIGFALHLIDLGNPKESSLHLKNLRSNLSISAAQGDTLDYLLGISLKEENPALALSYFGLATRTRAMAKLSATHASLLYADMRDYYQASKILTLVAGRETELDCLLQFEKSAVSLLVNGTEYKPPDPSQLCPDNLNLSQQYEVLNTNHQYLLKAKKKSPFVAGLLSAIVPGLGRAYAGKAKQGLGSFLPVVVLGALTYEGYANGGVTDARFIVFGSLFTIFELGNIWGSAMSVKLIQQEVNDQVHHQVTAAMAIPLELFLSKRD